MKSDEIIREEKRSVGLPSHKAMLRAFLARDASFEGLFFAGVTTTGIFCRPSCPARKPDPSHLEFFRDPAEATAAGYRPCLRCRPLEPEGTPEDWMACLIRRLEKDPGLRLRDSDLLGLGIHPARARRAFKRQYGLTFQAFARQRRLGQALSPLRGGASLDDVILGHGYESHSGFRQAFARLFGGPPGQRRGADCIFVAEIPSPFGPLVAAATAAGICFLEFDHGGRVERQLPALRRHLSLPVVPGENGHLTALRRELAGYFAGSLREFSVPLFEAGSAFERRVWDQLKRIPYGRTCSYRDIAAQLGRPEAARAVGAANGRNRIAILIPCHRVVNQNGDLGGYGGGVWRKRRLLELEREVVGKNLSSPDRPGGLA